MRSGYFVDERLRFASFILNVSFHEAPLVTESFAHDRGESADLGAPCLADNSAKGRDPVG